jgi:hypothetical protein
MHASRECGVLISIFNFQFSISAASAGDEQQSVPGVKERDQ